MENMTALVSTFVRAYHYRNNTEWVFADEMAGTILSEEEYESISHHMAEGISYFAPDFKGSKDDALRFIVTQQLAPSVLLRTAFCEQAIGDAMKEGCRQIILFACGYETFSLRTRENTLHVFELDQPEMIKDKQKRISILEIQSRCQVEYIGCDLSLPLWKLELIKRGFDVKNKAFGSLLGITYYLSKVAFRQLLKSLSSVMCEGSFICFDYPQVEDGLVSRRNRELAAAAGEAMKASYTYDDIKAMLLESGFIIDTHYNADEATDLFFKDYNTKNVQNAMKAPKGVVYCLAVKTD